MNYSYPILLLIFLIIIFDFFLIYLFPQSKRFWKQVDYFWVSLGFIGIIGATTSLRKELSLAKSNYYEQPLLSNYNSLKKEVQMNYKYFSDNIEGSRYLEFKDQKQARKFIIAGKFFKSQYDKILKYNDTILKYKNLNYIDTLNFSHNKFISGIHDDHVKLMARSSEFYLNQLLYDKNEFIKNEDLQYKNAFDWTLLFISPYLLAIAIAIRLTKVTAEIEDL